MERRHSTTSDSSTDSRQSVCDGLDGGIAGRVAKSSSPKIAVNPLQFVKVGPCDLYRSAQEQLKKVEEIKKAKKVQKDDVEDWQSNLDNWKCSRRKRQEHIIERVVEVKKIELEEHERNRRRSKTFNEMLQDRSTRGRLNSLPIYHSDETEDLSDLGIGCKNSESHELPTVDNNDGTIEINQSNLEVSESENNNDPNNECEKSTANQSEEYTYERAIQSYVNFAETRVKSRSLKEINYKSNKTSPPKVPVKPNHITFKNGDKSDQSTPSKKLIVPKVDVNRRRELFEKIQEHEDTTKMQKVVAEVPTTRTIKDRMSSLERHDSIDSSKETKNNSISCEKLVKERIESIKTMTFNKQSVNNNNNNKMKESISPVSLKDRLSNFVKTENNTAKKQPLIESSVSIKERLNNLQTSINKEPTKIVVSNPVSDFNEKLATFKENTIRDAYEEPNTNDFRAYSPSSDVCNGRRHYRHRSLDSLDVDNENISNVTFERVQSLEDLDYCRNYPPSTFSGDTDREDSGIHTADVSSSVSQADDYELHLVTNTLDDIKIIHQSNNADDNKLRLPDCVSYRCDEYQKPDNKFDELKCEESTFKDNHINEDLLNIVNVNKAFVANEIIQEELQKAKTACVETFNNDNESEMINDKTMSSLVDQLDSGEFTMSSGCTSSEDAQMEPIVINMDVKNEDNCVFNLSSAILEPPKEKPPPPPTEISDEEHESKISKKSALWRNDSTKRIKKEIRQKRSSFLGIEGSSDDSFLEPELELIKPPDMSALLAEERRMERQLYRQSVCSESDSNQESRDSGVELDHKHHDVWSHSRNDSETYGNQSTTSDEDEIMKKEREIIETLEKEEKIRKQDLGEKLAIRLRELEAEKERIEWEQLNKENSISHLAPPMYPEEGLHVTNEGAIKSNENRVGLVDSNYHISIDAVQEDWFDQRSSLQDITQKKKTDTNGGGIYFDEQYRLECRKSLQDLSRVISGQHHIPNKSKQNLYHRRSMPNLQETIQPRRPPPPPPILPHPELSHTNMINMSSSNHSSQQMTKQTLHALSAAPRSRLISNETWQAKRKQRPESYNYQHWLIQEAEHRRITESQQRQSAARRPIPSQHAYITSNNHVAKQHYPNQWVNKQPHTPVYTSWVSNQPQRNHQPKKHLPDSIIQTLTQRVQHKINSDSNNNRRRKEIMNGDMLLQHPLQNENSAKEKMLSVSGKKRCSHCGDELGRGAAMIIESLQLFYHIDCFKCCVCCLQLGDGLMGTDVRVRNNKLHCHNCYSSDDGAKFSCV